VFDTFGPSQLIDLTHTLKEGIPLWEGDQEFSLKKVTKDEDDFCMHEIYSSLGIGTHIDAPFLMGGKGPTISDLSLSSLIAKAFVISPEKSLEEFEKNYGEIEKGSFVIFHTGWGARWHHRKSYEKNFPTLDENTVKKLLERDVLGIGIDTLSPDSPESNFPNHHHLLKNGKLIIENLANTELLPLVGSQIALYPIKVAGVGEAPIRAVAYVPNLLTKPPLELAGQEGITLRQLFPEMALKLNALFKKDQEHLAKFLPWAEYPQSVASTRSFLFAKMRAMGEKTCLLLGIYKDSQLIGQVELHDKIDFQNHTAEIGYWLIQEEEGKGRMTKALLPLIDYAFTELNLHRLCIMSAVDNHKSSRVAQKLGFHLESIRKNGIWHQGIPHDAHLYVLLKD
jgi:kynurenine formamidase/RimJ/RimL family protein N-acetyltransferase